MQCHGAEGCPSPEEEDEEEDEEEREEVLFRFLCGAEGCPSPEKEDKEEDDEEEREEEPGVGEEAASATSCRLELSCATWSSIFLDIWVRVLKVHDFSQICARRI